MHGTYLIEVAYKEGIADPLARSVQQDVAHWGLKGLKKVATGQLYRLVGELSTADRHRIASDLLCDPVIQEFHDGGRDTSPKSVTIDVWYKQGVTDVVADSVMRGLQDLGIQSISQVRTGQRFRFLGVTDAKKAEQAAAALLMNPLVQDRMVHVG